MGLENWDAYYDEYAASSQGQSRKGDFGDGANFHPGGYPNGYDGLYQNDCSYPGGSWEYQYAHSSKNTGLYAQAPSKVKYGYEDSEWNEQYEQARWNPRSAARPGGEFRPFA